MKSSPHLPLAGIPHRLPVASRPRCIRSRALEAMPDEDLAWLTGALTDPHLSAACVLKDRERA